MTTPRRSLAAIAVAAMLVALLGALPGRAPAQADTRPFPPTPATVAADALPTVQVNGVVWAQVVVGNRVYAGGDFSTARPAGAAPGTNTTPRSGLLAYDIRNGQLITSFAPVLNGQVKTLAVSPDGTRVYAGGDFTTVNGQARSRIAAFNAATGALIPGFHPSVDNSVNAITVSNAVVYAGGNFTVASGHQRIRLAAFRPSDGALFAWAPRASGGKVWALTMSPDRSKLIVGGQFLNLNTNGPKGIGAVDPLTGGLVAWKAASQIRIGGEFSGIETLITQGNSVFGSGWVHGIDPQYGLANMEGAFRADGNTGTLEWVQDCHGDTYSVYATTTVVYSVGHAHDCRNIGGFPQKAETWHRALAVTRAPTSIVKHNTVANYPDWGGKPAPGLLHFDPHIAVGTFTGQNQGAWSIAGSGNGAYVVVGGEFPRVNGRAQQGLVRFAATAAAPNDVGPDLTGTGIVPEAYAFNKDYVWARFPANYDPDNETLTYRIRREDLLTPIAQFSARSSFWRRPQLGFHDVSVVPGTTYRYRIESVDPFGNTTVGDWVSVTPSPTKDPVNAYAKGVLADGAQVLWRLDARSGTLANNFAGGGPGGTGTGLTWGVPGAIVGSPNTAARFNGTWAGRVTSAYQQVAPTRFSLEAWVKTTSRSGGTLLGFADTAIGTSTVHDRHVYFRDDGRIAFGVYAGGAKVITSPKSYRDGKWHHVVATLDPTAGMTLYVDAVRVARRSGALSLGSYLGYWRLGGGTLTGWPGSPSSPTLAATLDEVAVYPAALDPAAVVRHYRASGDTAAH